MISIPWHVVACCVLGSAASFLLPPSELSWPNLTGVWCIFIAGLVAGDAR